MPIPHLSDPELTPLPAPRRLTRRVDVGAVTIGGGQPVAVQSMTKTDTHDSAATLAQIREAQAAGCEIMRVAVPDEDAVEPLRRIIGDSELPIVADIHFSHRLALAAIDAGAAKVRINPGNIGKTDAVRAVVERAGEAGIPLRIGVNAGSLERDLLDAQGHATAEALVTSALRHVERIESWGFRDIVVSIKASDVWRTVEACRRLSVACDYPLHIGVTEAGLPLAGTAKSAAALGVLLGLGIGDTIRVSLTADPVAEVRVAWHILSSMGIRRRGVMVVSCPTCGRTQIDLQPLAAEVEERLAEVGAPLTVAVMGCPVNGPGEAREADVGICGGKGVGIIFRGGEVIRRVPEAELLDALMEEVRQLAQERE